MEPECTNQFALLLQLLNLSGNKISHISPGVFASSPNLHLLDLSHNEITSISDTAFVGCESLNELHLNSNRLIVVPSTALQYLKRLKVLYIGSNYFKMISPGDFAHLPIEILHLDKCPYLTSIERSSFWDLPSLTQMHLHSNRHLYFIDSGSFLGVPSLSQLYLHNNSLLTLEEEFVESILQQSTLHSPSLLSLLQQRQKDDTGYTSSSPASLFTTASGSPASSENESTTAVTLNYFTSTSTVQQSPSTSTVAVAMDTFSSLPWHRLNSQSSGANQLLQPEPKWSLSPSRGSLGASGENPLPIVPSSSSSTPTVTWNAKEYEPKKQISQQVNGRKLQISLAGNPLLCDCNIRYLHQVNSFPLVSSSSVPFSSLCNSIPLRIAASRWLFVSIE